MFSHFVAVTVNHIIRHNEVSFHLHVIALVR